MAKLTKAARAKLKTSTFAEPAARKYPVPDAKHCASAKGFASMHGASASVKAAINAKCRKVTKKKA